MLDGSLEVRVSASGYLQGMSLSPLLGLRELTMMRSQAPIGHQVRKILGLALVPIQVSPVKHAGSRCFNQLFLSNPVGTLHDHVINFKVRFYPFVSQT